LAPPASKPKVGALTGLSRDFRSADRPWPTSRWPHQASPGVGSLDTQAFSPTAPMATPIRTKRVTAVPRRGAPFRRLSARIHSPLIADERATWCLDHGVAMLEPAAPLREPVNLSALELLGCVPISLDVADAQALLASHAPLPEEFRHSGAPRAPVSLDVAAHAAVSHSASSRTRPHARCQGRSWRWQCVVAEVRKNARWDVELEVMRSLSS
jgi:hypothetical protein